MCVRLLLSRRASGLAAAVSSYTSKLGMDFAISRNSPDQEIFFPGKSSPVTGDHSPGKPGKVREFQSGQGKVRENKKSQGKLKSVSSHS